MASLVSPLFENISPTLLIVSIPLSLLTVLAITYAYTTLSLRTALSRLTSSRPTSEAAPPPQLPYAVPWLGNSIAFLAPQPGKFWSDLFQWYPREAGACTILLGGRKTHVLFSRNAVLAVFKQRNLTRNVLNRDIREKALDVVKSESDKLEAGPVDDAGLGPLERSHKMFQDHLLRTESVNQLTTQFIKVMKEQIADTLTEGTRETGVYAWIQDIMFKASTTALFGQTILDLNPNLKEEFFEYDRVFMSLFFGIPKWMNGEAHRIRTRVINGVENWHAKMREASKGHIVDPDGDVDWEPRYGSRLGRASQVDHEMKGLNLRTRASMDLGLIFGLSSNAIPATGWMLLHLLDPAGDKTLLGRVRKELETAQREDGTLDVATLISLPLLQSIMQETVRLYTDVLVSRELKEDLIVPIDDEGRQVLLAKDSLIMAPSWLGQRDDTFWGEPASEEFFAERFLKQDPKTGEDFFTTAGTAGKLFPFGGGKPICPGRVFAKQEILASVAMLLLTFDFEFVDYVDDRGNSRKTFPGLRQSFGGSGVTAMEGDMKVRIKRRK